jgi:hypothetical protein
MIEACARQIVWRDCRSDAFLTTMRTLGHFRFALVSAGLLKFADDELRRHALAQAICGV